MSDMSTDSQRVRSRYLVVSPVHPSTSHALIRRTFSALGDIAAIYIGHLATDGILVLGFHSLAHAAHAAQNVPLTSLLGPSLRASFISRETLVQLGDSVGAHLAILSPNEGALRISPSTTSSTYPVIDRAWLQNLLTSYGPVVSLSLVDPAQHIYLVIYDNDLDAQSAQHDIMANSDSYGVNAIVPPLATAAAASSTNNSASSTVSAPPPPRTVLTPVKPLVLSASQSALSPHSTSPSSPSGISSSSSSPPSSFFTPTPTFSPNQYLAAASSYTHPLLRKTHNSPENKTCTPPLVSPTSATVNGLPSLGQRAADVIKDDFIISPTNTRFSGLYDSLDYQTPRPSDLSDQDEASRDALAYRRAQSGSIRLPVFSEGDRSHSTYGLYRTDVPESRNQFDLDRVARGLDTRTTVMLRNIPNRMTQNMLLEILERTVPKMYDWVYLRIDFQSGANVGYAFVNFIVPAGIVAFARKMLGRRWEVCQSDKVVQMSYANVQGKAALIEKFRSSSVMDERIEYQPRLFVSSGPRRGEPELFPEANDPVKVARSRIASKAGLYNANAAKSVSRLTSPSSLSFGPIDVESPTSYDNLYLPNETGIPYTTMKKSMTDPFDTTDMVNTLLEDDDDRRFTFDQQQQQQNNVSSVNELHHRISISPWANKSVDNLDNSIAAAAAHSRRQSPENAAQIISKSSASTPGIESVHTDLQHDKVIARPTKKLSLNDVSGSLSSIWAPL